MKKYETPEMNILVFENESAVMTSGVQTAIDAAVAAASDGTTIENSAGTLFINW